MFYIYFPDQSSNASAVEDRFDVFSVPPSFFFPKQNSTHRTDNDNDDEISLNKEGKTREILKKKTGRKRIMFFSISLVDF